MADKILGFDSAKDEAKRIGRDNMMISAPLVFELCEEIERQAALIEQAEEVVKAVAYIGVDFGYGPFQLGQDNVLQAQELLVKLK